MDTTEISERGRIVLAPCVTIDGRTVMMTGRLIRTAVVKDEDWLPGAVIPNPFHFIEEVRRSELNPDVFSFAQHFTDPVPHLPYHHNWDNVAAIPIATYDDWWVKHVSGDLRKDVKRAAKTGLSIRPVALDDDFLRGIKGVYDEAPVRQGRRFWHYGKDLDTIRRENSTYPDRCAFLGAYCQDELVGFLKIVYVDSVARLMQILSKTSHQDKRPTNALIAAAVRLASERGCTYLTYGRYTYDNKRDDPIMLFKRRNGFEQIVFPRYAVPLSARGRLLVATGLHLGVKRLVPSAVKSLLLRWRSRLRGSGVKAAAL